MNTMIDINPWNILGALLDTDTRLYKSMRARASGRFPPVNVYLDDNAVLIDMELPGKTAKDVDLTLEAQAVVVSDKPTPIADEKGRTEPVPPAWSRRIDLPFRVDSAKANAKFTDGILRIELPRDEATGVRRIAIAG